MGLVRGERSWVLGHSATHTRYVVVVARALGQQTVPYLPGEDARALRLVLGNLRNDRGRRDPRLAAPDGARFDRAGLVVPAQYLADAPVRHLQDAGDVAGPGARVGQLDNLLTGRVGQRAPIHVHTAELVDAAVAGRVAAEDRVDALYVALDLHRCKRNTDRSVGGCRCCRVPWRCVVGKRGRQTGHGLIIYSAIATRAGLLKLLTN